MITDNVMNTYMREFYLKKICMKFIRMIIGNWSKLELIARATEHSSRFSLTRSEIYISFVQFRCITNFRNIISFCVPLLTSSRRFSFDQSGYCIPRMFFARNRLNGMFEAIYYCLFMHAYFLFLLFSSIRRACSCFSLCSRLIPIGLRL